MNRLTLKPEQEITDMLFPSVQKLLAELGIKHNEFGEDFFKFIHDGHEITIQIKSKPTIK